MDSSGVMGHSGDGNPEYIAERTAVSAIAGGTASVLSGGKFANGAITGAFAQLYNAENWTRTEPPAGASIEPYLVPYKQMSEGSKQIMQYRVFQEDAMGKYWVGFAFPSSGTEIGPTYYNGREVGLAISPPGSPPIEWSTGKNPSSGVRIGLEYSQPGSSFFKLPYFRVFNAFRQPISPVTGKPVPDKSDFAHYPVNPLKPIQTFP